MRHLRLSWSRASGAVPLLVAAAVLPGACGGNVDTNATTGGGGTSASTGTDTLTGTGGSGVIDFTGGAGGATTTSTGVDLCPEYAQEMLITVPLPEPGVPAEPGQICAQSPPSVVSNTAARVTLTKYGEALNLAMGFVAIAPELQGTVVGTPAIEVVAAALNDLLGMVASDVQATQGGFTFHAEWPQPFDLPPESWVSMTVKTTFTSQCGPNPGDERTVEALTIIHLCMETLEERWLLRPQRPARMH